jgi:ankyrin repeat protein
VFIHATHDPTVVSYLLEQDANPNLGPGIGGGIGDARSLQLVSNSGAVLQNAAQRGSIKSVDLLLAHGAVLSNAAPLHAAVEGESLEMMSHLLSLGVDVDGPDSYWTMGFPCYVTPLLRAILNGKVDAVRFLLGHGASVTTRTTAYHGSKTALELVTQKGISIDIRAMVEIAGQY